MGEITINLDEYPEGNYLNVNAPLAGQYGGQFTVALTKGDLSSLGDAIVGMPLSGTDGYPLDEKYRPIKLEDIEYNLNDNLVITRGGLEYTFPFKDIVDAAKENIIPESEIIWKLLEDAYSGKAPDLQSAVDYAVENIPDSYKSRISRERLIDLTKSISHTADGLIVPDTKEEYIERNLSNVAGSLALHLEASGVSPQMATAIEQHFLNPQADPNFLDTLHDKVKQGEQGFTYESLVSAEGELNMLTAYFTHDSRFFNNDYLHSLSSLVEDMGGYGEYVNNLENPPAQKGTGNKHR